MSFAELGLSEAIVRSVTENGYTQPTPIQAQAIPAVLKGGDLQEELKAFKNKASITPLSDYFEEEFFETKKIVYLPAPIK